MADESATAVSVRGLIRPHADVLVDATTSDAIGPGWGGIAMELFAAWAAELARTPRARLAISFVGERAGALSVVCEAAEGMPPGHLDMHEIRDLQHRAEIASLRTCDRCGRRGVLRRVPDVGFATRCERHAETASGRIRHAEALLPAEVVGNSLRCHADWLASDGAFAEVPRGWLGLVTEFLARARDLPRGAEASFRLLEMRAVRGRLDIRIEHDIEDLDMPGYLDWRGSLMAVGDAAFFTCDVCGADGRVRPTRQGVPPPRCDAHADTRRWRSCQWAAHSRRVEPLVVLSSARPQWTIDALEVAATPIVAPREAPAGTDAFPLYDVRDVAAALGLADNHEAEEPSDADESPRDNEHQARLRRILESGDAGRWRRVTRPDRGMVDRLDELGRRAPHLEALSTLVRRHLLAALHIGLPVVLPPLLVVGAPGIGKTWFLKGLSRVLGIPFRDHAMSAASHSDGVGGAHPVWRNSQPGLVAKVLLGEEVANPLIFIDEFDKVPPGHGVDDLFRPYYVLLEPLAAKRFTDAFLGFPIDASQINWVMAANGTGPIPPPILSRLTVVHVAPPERAHLAAIARSVYADCNARRLGHFPQEPEAAVVARLADLTPRAMRMAVDDAMTSAAAEGRRYVRASDIVDHPVPGRARMGFV